MVPGKTDDGLSGERSYLLVWLVSALVEDQVRWRAKRVRQLLSFASPLRALPGG